MLEEADEVTVGGGLGREVEMVTRVKVLVSRRLVLLGGSAFVALEVSGEGRSSLLPPLILKGKLYWKMVVSDSRVMMMP